jgi:hypothetical protein
MNPDSSPPVSSLFTRREALQRAAVAIGVALSPALLANALRAQSTPAAAGSQLSPSQLAAVAAMAERILPRTDTPGASDVDVAGFIDRMYGEFLTPAERRTLVTGLAELEKSTAASARKAFVQLDGAAQDRVLSGLATSKSAATREFFRQMRELTVVGYFTSEKVGKTVLHYDPVPGRWDADVAIAEVGNRNWTR